MFANELTMLSKLAALVLAAGTGVEEEAGFDVAVAGFAMALAVPAKLGMWAEMLLAMLFMEGGAEGAGGAEPPMAAATPANEGMFAAMKSVTPARVGKTTPRSKPEGGRRGTSSEVE